MATTTEDLILVHAQPDLNAALNEWLDHLADERRLSDKTLVAYGFLLMLTEWLRLDN